MRQPESTVAIPIIPCSMEDRVMNAARLGDIDTLYQLIGEDVDVLRRINEIAFMDTPLHVASAAGKTDFAMEMMCLMPAFAKKLNKDGLSPLHLALQEGHTELVLSLLKFDESLGSFKGKMGYTPLHYLVMKEMDHDLLIRFLNEHHNCIDAVTCRDETALHVAARKNLTALKVLLRWLGRTHHCSMLQKQRILDSQNKDGDTVLHVAVSNPERDPEVVRLLLDLRIDRNLKNSKKLTALGILNDLTEKDGINIKKCVDILRPAWRLSLACKIYWYFVKIISQWGFEIKNMSTDRGNALLVVTVLILTATYQSTLSPPGGVLQAHSVPSKSKFSGLEIYFGSKNTSHVVEKIKFKDDNTPGSSVLSTQSFLWFFIPNIVAFLFSFVLTCFVLLIVVSGFFSVVLVLSLSTLLFCLLDSALLIISPNNQSSRILFTYVYSLLYLTILAIAPVLIPKVRKFFK